MRNGGTKRDLENIFAAKERIEKLSIPEPMSGCWLWLGGVEQNLHVVRTVLRCGR
jgi:hypothetical protein